MNYFRLILASCLISLPSTLVGAPVMVCDVSWSISGEGSIYKPIPPVAPVPPPLPVAPVPPPLPVEVTKTTETTGTVTTTVSAFTAVGTSQIAQGSRAFSLMEMAACDDASEPDSGAPSWADSPTQLSIGSSALQYDLGTVVGNWALLTGIAASWGIIATKLGRAEARFPGGLTIPVLFLISPTTTSAVSLLRGGNITQQLVGGLSVTMQAIGVGVIAMFLHPTFFKAQWVLEDDGADWRDQNEPGYVNRYGILFRDYREGRHIFIAVEFLMSIATGTLNSYQASQNNCRSVVTAAAGMSSAYALSMALLRPNARPNERIFYAAIAGIQALALTMQAASLWVGSEETQAKTRTVAQSVVMVAQWALMVKSVYDVARRFRSIYHYFQGRRVAKPEQRVFDCFSNREQLPLEEDMELFNLDLSEPSIPLVVPEPEPELVPTPVPSPIPETHQPPEPIVEPEIEAADLDAFLADILEETPRFDPSVSEHPNNLNPLRDFPRLRVDL